jgi:hypothetical protein
VRKRHSQSGPGGIAKWLRATTALCRAHLILLAYDQRRLWNTSHKIPAPSNCTYLLLATLIARPLHGRVPPRVRASARILAIFCLVVARSRSLEGLSAHTGRAVCVRKLDSLRPRCRRGHGKHWRLRGVSPLGCCTVGTDIADISLRESEVRSAGHQNRLGLRSPAFDRLGTIPRRQLHQACSNSFPRFSRISHEHRRGKRLAHTNSTCLVSTC